MNPAAVNDLEDTAAAWYRQMNAEKVSPDLRERFERWLSEAPAHRNAYDAVARTWAFAQQAKHDPEVMAMRHDMAIRLTRQSSSWSFWSVRVAAAAALVAVGVAAVMAFGVFDRTDDGNRYATATGQRLAITLPDGSQMTLNTQTRVRAAYTPKERTVILEQGQALFEVEKEPGRPFVVVAGGQRMTAVGTAFDVRVEGERVQLTMVEGRVDAGGLLLSAGEQVTLDASVDTPSRQQVKTTNADRATSWRRGQVIFEDTSLADAIAELNRYSERKIVLDDPALGNLEVSGAYATSRTGVFVDALARYFRIEVLRSDEKMVVLGLP